MHGMNGCPKVESTAPQGPEGDGRLECRICWYVYDPAAGDPVGQVSRGTPFAALPAAWHCPQCDAPRDQFLPLGHA